jgi:GNAT superfamily N-acetyltransferase
MEPAMIDPRIVVEDAQAYLPTRPSSVRLDAGDVVLRHSPHSPHYWYGSATRPRFSEATIEQRVAEVRGWFHDHDRLEFMWMVGDSATPPGLVDRLLASGARLSDDPHSDAMILDHEPPPAPPGIAIRRIETFDDYAASMRIALEDTPPEAWAKTEAGLEAAWAEARSDDQIYGFLAIETGVPVGAGQLVWLRNGLPYLGGAATLRASRGRGAFRALVRARWDEAARRGVPILLVQAGGMSAPILEGLGFRTVGHVRTLVDRAG